MVKRWNQSSVGEEGSAAEVTPIGIEREEHPMGEEWDGQGLAVGRGSRGT